MPALPRIPKEYRIAWWWTPFGDHHARLMWENESYLEVFPTAGPRTVVFFWQHSAGPPRYGPFKTRHAAALDAWQTLLAADTEQQLNPYGSIENAQDR